MYFDKIFILEFLISYAIGLNNNINMDEYSLIPNLYRFDDYEKCFDVFQEKALYCVVNSYIKPDLSSDIYKLIDAFSSNQKQHLRHDKLQRGLCINICDQKVQRLGNESTKYLIENFPKDSNLVLETFDYPNAERHRIETNNLINKCVNIELMNEFELSSFSAIEYCMAKNEKLPWDTLDILPSVLLISLLTVVTISSICDKESKDNSKTPTRVNKIQQILKNFSIKRNWKILSTPVNEKSKELTCIDSFRFITTIGVIQFHCTMYSFMIPSSNPVFIEETYSSVQTAHRLMGNPGMQAFLVVGGFLNAYTFMGHLEKGKTSWSRLLIMKALGRYIRLASIYMFVVLMHATMLYRLGDGPFWNRMNYPERQFCRQSWWTNLLLVDNYINVEQKCLIQTWYLPVDFWLHIAANLCLIYIYKNPASKNWIITASILLSAAAIGSTVFFNELEPVPFFPADNVRNQFLKDRVSDINYFKEMLIPTHLNIGNYFIGITAGLIYHFQKKSKEVYKKTFWSFAVWTLCIIIFLCLNYAVNFLFYTYDFDKTTLLNAAVAIVIQHAYGVTGAVITLGFLNGYGGCLNKILTHKYWRFFGRISYSTLMCHVFVLKVLMPSLKNPIVYSDSLLAWYGIIVCLISVFVGFLLTMFIEFPVVSAYNMLTQEQAINTKL